MVIAPLALLGTWGYSYVRDCIGALSAPGVPIEYSFRTPIGMAQLRATSYTLGLSRGLVLLTRPRLYDPEGKLLASAEEVAVSGIDLRHGSDQAVQISVRNLFGRLTRLKNGKFQLQYLIPNRVGKPAQIPYFVDVKNAKLELIDEEGSRPFSLVGTSPRIRIAGVTDDWTASATVSLPNIGAASAVVHRTAASGIRVDLDTPGLELISVLRHLKETPEAIRFHVPDVAAGSVSVKGPASIFVSARGAVAVRAQSSAVLTQVAYKEYHADRLTFQGFMSEKGAVGHGEAQDGQTSGSFEGGAEWSGEFRAGGSFDVRSRNAATLPAFARKLLPKGAGFNGAEAKGWAEFQDPRRYWVQGDAHLNSVTVRNQTAYSVGGEFSLNPATATVNLETAKWTGQSVTGGAAIALHDKTITGGIRAPSVNLNAIAVAFHHPELSGQADGKVLIRGTIEHPRLSFASVGVAKLKNRSVHLQPLKFEAHGTYDDGTLTIARGDLEGHEGDAFFSGAVRPDRSINFRVVGRQVRLDALSDSLEGQLNAEATVSGTASAPVATGRAEAYAVKAEGHEIPLITTDFVANTDIATFTHARVIQGAAQADGSGQYLFATHHMSAQASATGVQLADYLGSNYLGAVDLSNISLVGSIKAPLVSGDVTGDSLVMNGIKVDHVQIHATGDRNTITLESGSALLAGGAVSATGEYDFGTRRAHVQLQSTPLNLGQLADSYSTDVSFGGTIDGTASVELQGSEIQSATGKGRLVAVAIGGSILGDGPWTVTGEGKKLTGSLQVGRLDRFVELSNLQLDYGPDHPIISGDADIFNFSMSDIANIGLKYFPNLSYDAFNAVQSVSGSLNASLHFDGDIHDPDVSASTLTASNLQVLGEQLGDLDARVSRKNRNWDVSSFRLVDGQGTLSLNGTVAEQGGIHLDGDLSTLPLSRLVFLNPRLANATGQVSASFSVKGQTAQPTVQASVSATGILQDPASKDADRSLRVELAPITISETQYLPGGKTTGGIEIAGSYYYRGFAGEITARAPLKYPLEIPKDGAVQGHVTMAERDLKDIAGMVGGIDAKRSQGSVGGNVDVSGTFQNIALRGDVDLVASTFAASGMDDPLNDFGAHIHLENDTVKLTVDGKGSLGGTVHGSLSTQLGDLSSAVSKASSDGIDTVLSKSLAGDIHFDKLKFKQSFAERTYAQGVLGGDITFGGTFRRPTVTGSASISNLDSVVPAINASAEEPQTPTIDPTFDLQVALADTAHVNASTADLYLNGSGRLGGRLSQPQANAKFVVQKGQLRLPSSTVRIEDGGTVAFSYQKTVTDTISHLAVDLTGLTQVVAPGSADTIQRYDITLGVKGDLLSADGLQLTASSDPPDLTQDRILALLGQTDALQSINPGSGVSRSEAQRQIQSAFVGFALPSFASPITSSIARSLGFDYLDLGFNAYQSATFSFAKALGSDLTFQGSRGISQPPPGYPFQFDYRLVLHPRRFGGILSRISLFVGTDQDNYYKVGLIYGIKF